MNPELIPHEDSAQWIVTFCLILRPNFAGSILLCLLCVLFLCVHVGFVLFYFFLLVFLLRACPSPCVHLLEEGLSWREVKCHHAVTFLLSVLFLQLLDFRTWHFGHYYTFILLNLLMTVAWAFPSPHTSLLGGGCGMQASHRLSPFLHSGSSCSSSSRPALGLGLSEGLCVLYIPDAHLSRLPLSFLPQL